MSTETATKATDYAKGNEAIRIAHNLATQGMIARQAKHNEDLRQAVNGEAVDLQKGDEMGQNLNIDSPTTITNHFATAPGDTRKNSKAGKLAKFAIGAGLMASGAAIPMGAAFVLDALKDKPTPIVEPGGETRYSLDLGD